MKYCPHCKMNIGGNHEKCPLCQNALEGVGERDYWPKVEENSKRLKAFKIVLFTVLAVCILNFAADYFFIKTEHLSWSPIVVAWLLVSGWILELVLKKHYNLLKTMLVAILALCALCQVSEIYMHWAWEIPYLGITPRYIMPILCSANIVANFVLSLVDKHFTDHSLIYMFINILIGVVPWVALLFFEGRPPLAWNICVVINILVYIYLFVFRGRIVINEFKKRFHM